MQVSAVQVRLYGHLDHAAHPGRGLRAGFHPREPATKTCAAHSPLACAAHHPALPSRTVGLTSPDVPQGAALGRFVGETLGMIFPAIAR